MGNCDSGYSCAYTNSISWRGPAIAAAAAEPIRAWYSSACSAPTNLTSTPPFARAAPATARACSIRPGRNAEAGRRTSVPPTAARSTNTSFAIREMEQRIQKAPKTTMSRPGHREAGGYSRESYADYAKLHVRPSGAGVPEPT